jgi:NAD(P)H-dependent flavin oxidoreductase YrpB (nitropropane dioxygenase family)
MLSTTLTRRFGIDHPIVQAGMGMNAGKGLAAAVSNVGGLGTRRDGRRVTEANGG